jgi:biopolymer transport protein TolR
VNQRSYYSKRSKRRPVSDINIVPYIDVMLVLLMVFMITTPLLNQSVKVQLPKTQSQQIKVADQKPIVVTVNKAGQYYCSIAKDPKTILNQKQLQALVGSAISQAKASHTTRHVYVRGDSQASYGEVIKAMVVLQNAGADHVGLVTQPKS